MSDRPSADSTGRSYRTILVWLFIAYLLSFADRVAFGMVLKPIKATFLLSDTQAGTLVGAAFAISYAGFSPLGGYLVDRFTRRNILAFAIAFWSLATLGCGLATSFITLAIARVAVGAGEALLHPLTVSIVGDVVPAPKRSSAFAVYLSAGALGAVAAWLFGGALVHKLTGLGALELPLIGSFQPWQSLFGALAVPGFVLAAVVWSSMKEPRRQVSGHEDAVATTDSVLAFVRRQPKLSAAILIGCALNAMAGYAVLSWLFVFFDRAYGWPAGKSGLVIGLTAGVTFILGCASGGRLIEYIRRRGYADAALRTSAISGTGYAVFMIAALVMPNPIACLVMLMFAFAFGYVPVICAYSAIAEAVPSPLRARFTGLNTLTTGILANSLGPLFVGLLSDHVFKSSDGIRWSLITVVAGGVALGSFLCSRGLASLREIAARRSVVSLERRDRRLSVTREAA